MSESSSTPIGSLVRRVRVGLSIASLVALSFLAIRSLLPSPSVLGTRARQLSPGAQMHAPSPAPAVVEPTRERDLPNPRAPEPIAPFDEGLADRVVRLPDSDDYDIRCPYNAYATPHTISVLSRAISSMRASYPGQLVIGDISRRYGGSYGAHRSHRSGRDVDIWLPIAGGLYRTARECAMCGRPWCRAVPDEVDWRVTWTLIRALEATGAVERIFLERSLHPRLRAAAFALGERPEAVERAIQPRPGAPALVMHSDGHTRHLHVRFACGAGETDCVD